MDPTSAGGLVSGTEAHPTTRATVKRILAIERWCPEEEKPAHGGMIDPLVTRAQKE
jgi:hypothetical protein